jgi:hypothetical protein
VRDLQRHAGPAERGDDAQALRHVQRQRFLAQRRLAGPSGGQGKVCVCVTRRTDVDDVDVPQERLKVGERVDALVDGRASGPPVTSAYQNR